MKSYGHVQTVNSPNHTFFWTIFSWACLTNPLTSTLGMYTFTSIVVTDNNPL